MTPAATYEEETQDQPIAPPVDDFGSRFERLPAQLRNAITAAVKDAQNQEKFLRRLELLQDAEHRFYDMGIQHIYQNRAFCWTQATAGGSYQVTNGDPINYGEYLDDYDIFHPYALILIAKLTEHNPGIDFQPDDPNRPEDLEAAAAAEGMRHEFERNNNVKELQKAIIYHLEMGGRAVAWTRTIDADYSFGVSTSGAPRRQCTTTIHGCIEAKVPIFEDHQRGFWYVLIYDDPDIKNAKQDYPWIADKLNAGKTCLDEGTYERIARLGVVSTSRDRRGDWNVGDSIDHVISRANAFLRLSAFQDCNDPYQADNGYEFVLDEATGAPKAKTVKQKLAEIFPNGIHAVIVGDEYAWAESQSMDDCLSVSHAFIGKGQSRMPIMRPMVVVQDRFNQTMNYIAESNDYVVPCTWLSCEPAEYAAISKQESKPGGYRNMKSIPNGAKLSDMIHREPGPELPADFGSYIDLLKNGLPQFQLSAPPSLWGQAMSDQKTASGYQLAASQAMGILAQLWDVEVAMFAQIFYHGCLAVSRDGEYSQEIVVPGQNGQNVVIQKESLSKGNFRAYPDKESGFPESTNQTRQSLERFAMTLSATPLAAQIFGSPDNVAEMIRVQGLNITLPENEARNKQTREIDTLLGQPPMLAPPLAAMLASGKGVQAVLDAIQGVIEAAQAQYAEQVQEMMTQHAAETMAAKAQGQPEPEMPPPPPPFDPTTIARSSVPVWNSDFHLWEARLCRDWLSKPARYNEETIGRPSMLPEDSGALKPNIAGILNVVLHMMEHEAKEMKFPTPATAPLPATGSPPAVRQLPSGAAS